MIRIILIILCLIPHVMFAQSDFVGDDHDASKPISIVSDDMVLKSKKNIAIFSGNVTAIQGTLRIMAKKMIVYYHGEESEKRNTLSKVAIIGGAKIIMPGKWAKAERGIYDVDNSIITLDKNVALTRGPNILRGRKFVYDVKNGTSRMFGDKKSYTSAGNKKGIRKKRVRGYFIPRKKPR